MATSTAASLAKSLAIEDSAVCSLPESRRTAAFQVRSRAASTLVTMSAILNWMAWKSAMAWPNCRRSVA